MEYDSEGCEYPRVDVSSCIDCGRCERACPVLNAKPERERSQRAWLAQHLDPAILERSTSGGAMTAIAQVILANGGVVFGAAFLEGDELGRADGAPGPLVVGHVGIESEADLHRLQGSKYVQSIIGPTYREVHEALARGRETLFCGTPCQCEGLLSYLGERPHGLLVADVVCHAVVCRTAFSSYQRWLAHRAGAIGEVRFRDKTRYGYRYSSLRALGTMEDGHREVVYEAGVESDPYLRAFFSDVCDRPICYVCPFKKRWRESDLTCWDCFDVHRLDKAFDDNRGVTRVLAHTDAGAELVGRAAAWLRLAEIDADAAVEGSREMTVPVERNSRRDEFMAEIATGEGATFDQWFPDSLKVKFERAVRRGAERMGVYDQAKRSAKWVLRR